MGSVSKATTPLAKALRYLGLTQEGVAARLGVRQGAFSKLVRRIPRPAMAARVLNEVDPERRLLTELHLLFPERYPDWEPPVGAAPNGTVGTTSEPPAA
jgi:hypothetical protein